MSLSKPRVVARGVKRSLLVGAEAAGPPALETIGTRDSNGGVIHRTAQVLSILWGLGLQSPFCRSVMPQVASSACALGGLGNGFSGSHGMPDGLWGGRRVCRINPSQVREIGAIMVYSMRIGVLGAPRKIQDWGGTESKEMGNLSRGPHGSRHPED